MGPIDRDDWGWVAPPFVCARIQDNQADAAEPEELRPYAERFVEYVAEFNYRQALTKKMIRGYTLGEWSAHFAFAPDASKLWRAYAMHEFIERRLDAVGWYDGSRPVPVVRIREDITSRPTLLPASLIQMHNRAAFDDEMDRRGLVMSWGKIESQLSEISKLLEATGGNLYPVPYPSTIRGGLVKGTSVLVEPIVFGMVTSTAVALAKKMGAEHVAITGKAHDVEKFDGDVRRYQFADHRPSMKHRLNPMPVPSRHGDGMAAWVDCIERVVSEGLTCLTGTVFRGDNGYTHPETGEAIPAQFDFVPVNLRHGLRRFTSSAGVPKLRP